MKKLPLLYLLTLLCLTPLNSQNCPGGTAAFDLHANAVSARIRNNGRLFTDGQNGHFFPNPSANPNFANPTTIFTAGLWMAGIDAAGNLKISAVTYHPNGYSAGPVDPLTLTVDPQSCADWDRMFTVRDDRIAAFLAQLPNLVNNPAAAIAQFPEIMGWPGLDNPHFEAVNGFSLPTNRVQELAPYFDHNGDARYNPLDGDYPVMILQGFYFLPTVLNWCVFNTLGNNPVGINFPAEIQQSAWAFDCPEPEVLSRTVFTNHRILYRSDELLDSVHLGIWVDTQVGNCGLTSDYLGSIPALQAFYATSNRLDDNCMPDIPGFSGRPPIQSVTMLNRPMDHFMYYNNASIGTPLAATTSPTTLLEYFRYLTGHWRDGLPLIAGGSGYASSGPRALHAFPDDPAAPSGWSICTANLPSFDRRGLAVCKANSVVSPLQVDELTTAWAFHDMPGTVCNLGNTPADIAVLRQLYDDAFDGLCSALTPALGQPVELPGLRLAPNPADTNIRLFFDRETPAWVRLIDAQGRQVFRAAPDGGETFDIAVQLLPAGWYSLSCQFSAGVAVRKILIQHPK